MRRRELIKRRAKLLRQVETAARVFDTPELELDHIEVTRPAAAIPAEPAAEQELDFG